MDTDTVAGLFFLLSGLAMFVQAVLRPVINQATIFFTAISIVLISLGTVIILRNRNTSLFPAKAATFSMLAVALFVSGFIGYFYL